MEDNLQAAEPADLPQNETPEVSDSGNEATPVAETQQQEPQKTDDGLPKGVRKSIDRLTRQRYQAEARAEMLERQLAEERAARQSQPQKPADNQAAVPTLEQFGGDWDKYMDAKAEYIAEQKYRQLQAQTSQQTASQQEQQIVSRQRAEFGAAMEQAFINIPDMLEVLETTTAPITPTIERAIFALGADGPAVAYHLAKNPEEARQIAGMDAFSAAARIGRISATLQKPVPKQSNAPTPVSDIKPKATVQKSPDTMTDAEFEAYMKGKRK